MRNIKKRSARRSARFTASSVELCCARLPDDDLSDRLRTSEELAAHVNAAFEEGDAAAVAKALAECARAKGMSQVARDAGLSRESLYKWLDGDRRPDFQTIVKVVRALGLKLTVRAVAE